jgi:hypothetical protein
LAASPGQIAVEVSEQYADQLASDEKLRQAHSDARRIADECDPIRAEQVGTSNWDYLEEFQASAIYYFASACACASYPGELAFAAAAETVSDVSLGIAMTLNWPDAHGVEEAALAGLAREIFGNPFFQAVIDQSWLTRRDGAVVKLAQAIYADRVVERLHVLADALEDAGCTDADLLGHLRGPGPHVRGCWALDLILGKE